MPLTDTKIRTLKIPEKPIKLADGAGLHLYCSPTGRKYWRMSYSFDNKAKLLSFGEYPGITLQRAREKRMEARRLLDEGIDPGALKKAAKEAERAEVTETFRNIAKEWHEARTDAFTEKHRITVMYRLEKFVFPVIGDKHIDRIEPRDILAFVRPIDQQGHNETARRLMQIISQVYRYALIDGRAKRNPASDLSGALRPRRVTHRAAITEPKKVAQLLCTLDNYQGHFPIVCALRLAPLVFVRPGELRAAEWSEFNFEDQEWRIPAARMKMKQIHIVPLSKQAVAILEELRPYSGNGKYLFPSQWQKNEPMGKTTMLAALRGMGIGPEEMTPHGFRAMARTLLDEVLGERYDLIEQQLAHMVRDPNGRAYNRTQHLAERKRMMARWADYLDGLRNEAGLSALP